MVDRRKLENIAAALPIFGAVIILPPIVGVFATDARIFGTPLIVIYLFAIWLLFIFGTILLSRRLKTRLESDITADSDDSAGGD